MYRIVYCLISYTAYEVHETDLVKSIAVFAFKRDPETGKTGLECRLIHTHTHTHTRMYTHTYTQVNIHIFMDRYTCVCVCVCVESEY